MKHVWFNDCVTWDALRCTVRCIVTVFDAILLSYERVLHQEVNGQA